MANEIEDLKVQEYQLTRKARLLESELFMGEKAKDRDDAAQQHAELHARLGKAADARRAKEAEAGKGVIRRERPTAAQTMGGQMMGAETTGIDATIALRMSQVPTAIVQLLDPKTPLVSVTLKNAGSKWARMRVVSEVAGYSARAVETSSRTSSSCAVDAKHPPDETTRTSTAALFAKRNPAASIILPK